MPGYDSSFPYAVNDAGQIVGVALGAGNASAFLYSHGAMIDIGAIGGVSRSLAYSINNRGQVVGRSVDQFIAFLFDNGNFIDLNRLPEVQMTGWRLISAFGINDRGQIIATGLKGTEARTFLLTP